MEKIKTIVLGGGCFWCTEAVFKRIKGVVKTTPGYAGGSTANPTYEEVCSHETGHAEVLKVEYDDSVMPIDELLEIFFAMHDPTSLNKQGNDEGNQYRSIILCSDDEQMRRVMHFIDEHRKEYEKEIVTEVKMLNKFYPAEAYHNDYFARNPIQPYCIFVIRPKIKKIMEKFEKYIVR